MYLARLRFAIRHSRFMRNTLRKYEMLIAVSKSVPYEMGPDWINRINVLDPGVSLGDEDIELISKTRNVNKEEHVVFGGRVDALKGFIEGLYVFRELVKHSSSLKLVVAGHVSSRLRARIEILQRILGLDGEVILTGTLPRPERFKAVSRARLMIYPSHVDAFPYTVLESLYLGTPVVAYDMPALRIHYSDSPGVKLVEEGNVEALTVEAFNLLESKDICVEKPKLRSWSDIMKEEVELVKSPIEHGGLASLS